MADWVITLTNLQLGQLRYDVLVFTVAGVLVGGQIGPRLARFLPARGTKIVFGISVATIGAIDVVTAWPQVLALLP